MRQRDNPRYAGKITSWKDEQGFGFITPNGGGPSVFVHIKSFAGGTHRPAVGASVTYHLSVNEKGQARADNVGFAGDRAPQPTPARSGSRQLLAMAGFLMLVALLVLAGKLPGLVLAVYGGVSLLTFCAYAFDKSAARNGRRRTPEDTLHLLAIAGGWPGAILAQQLMRHKSTKVSFRRVFWVTVAVNCAALALLVSPAGAGLLRSILAGG